MFALSLPRVLQFAVDDLGHAVTASKLAWFGLVLLGLSVAGGVFRFLMRRLVIGASRSIEFEIRNDFFEHVEHLPLATLQARRTGDLISRATTISRTYG